MKWLRWFGGESGDILPLSIESTSEDMVPPVRPGGSLSVSLRSENTVEEWSVSSLTDSASFSGFSSPNPSGFRVP